MGIMIQVSARVCFRRFGCQSRGSCIGSGQFRDIDHQQVTLNSKLNLIHLNVNSTFSLELIHVLF